MKSLKYPSKQELESIFKYRNDGQLIWKDMKGKKRPEAGFNNGRGRYRIQIEDTTYYRSILVWIYHNGDFDDALQIDHVNLIKKDDRIENLRVVSASQNAKNKIPKSNTDLVCISYHKCSNNYMVSVAATKGEKKLTKYFKRLKHAVLFRDKTFAEYGVEEYYNKEYHGEPIL